MSCGLTGRQACKKGEYRAFFVLLSILRLPSLLLPWPHSMPLHSHLFFVFSHSDAFSAMPCAWLKAALQNFLFGTRFIPIFRLHKFSFFPPPLNSKLLLRAHSVRGLLSWSYTILPSDGGDVIQRRRFSTASAKTVLFGFYPQAPSVRIYIFYPALLVSYPHCNHRSWSPRF